MKDMLQREDAVIAMARFTELVHALATGNEAKAAQAREDLRRLGLGVAEPRALERPTDAPPSTSAMAVRASDAAACIGVSRAHFLRMVASGRAPRGLKLGARRVWSKSELAAWIEAGAPSAARWEALRRAGGAR